MDSVPFRVTGDKVKSQETKSTERLGNLTAIKKKGKKKKKTNPIKGWK